MLESSTIIGKKILVLTAHPDDETFLGGGTIYANYQAGAESFLACATLGEKGTSHLKTPLSEAELKVIRQKELQTAAAMLGIKQTFELDFPDGGVDKHETKLFQKAEEILNQIQPELIMSFGLDGITGHRDHIAVGRVAEKLASQHGLPLAMFCLPKSILPTAMARIKTNQRTKGHYAQEFSLVEGNVSITIDKEIKLGVLKNYVSQLDNQDPFANYSPDEAQVMLTEEAFFFRDAKLD